MAIFQTPNYKKYTKQIREANTTEEAENLMLGILEKIANDSFNAGYERGYERGYYVGEDGDDEE